MATVTVTDIVTEDVVKGTTVGRTVDITDTGSAVIRTLIKAVTSTVIGVIGNLRLYEWYLKFEPQGNFQSESHLKFNQTLILILRSVISVKVARARRVTKRFTIG